MKKYYGLIALVLTAGSYIFGALADSVDRNELKEEILEELRSEGVL